MSKAVLLATEKPFSASARNEIVRILEEAGYRAVVLESYAEDPRGKAAALRDAVKDVDAMIIRSDVIDAEILAAAPALRLVVRAGAGYDNVDCAAARAGGVAVMNTPGQNANAVAELAIAMMIFMARGQFDGKTGTELRGKTLGLHAVGAVGRAVAPIARGLGMKVRGFDPFQPEAAFEANHIERVLSVEAIFEGSNVLSLHVPATPETKGCVNKALLGLLPRGALILNTARKEIIAEADLLEVLASMRTDLRYASDIAPSAAVMTELREKCGNRVYVTPAKMGAQTQEANVNSGLAAARQIVGFFEKGDRTFVVNP